MGKNDLSGLKLKTEKKLPSDSSTSLLQPKKVGRPKKSVDECDSEPVTLKLTPLEMQILKNKAGLVPLSRYIKHYLRTESNLFEK
jgi:hypothetical protein